ncbi:hypothetical protein [Kitasatospora sp. NPDC057198]|uniref:hypothetical protein n=1 Tax=Kitasatospora sp. NPDC057198 TaxID=3346046 RepID=UPI00362A29DC
MAVLSGAAWSAVTYLVNSRSWPVAIVSGVFCTLLFLPLFHWAYRRRARRLGLRDASDLVELNRAVKEERIPEDPAQLAALRTLIRADRKQRRRAWWMWVVICGSELWLAASSWARHGPLVGALVLLFLLCWIPTLFVLDRRQRDRLRRLESRLDG